MTTTLAADITASVRWNNQTNDGATARIVSDANVVSLVDSLAEGTGAGQADLIYHAQLALTTSPTTLDLQDGTLTDIFGNSLVFDYIKTIMIKPDEDSSSYVTMDGTFQEYISSPGASSGLVVYGGGVILLHNPTATPWAVTVTTDDEITLTGSASVSCDVVIIGTT